MLDVRSRDYIIYFDVTKSARPRLHFSKIDRHELQKTLTNVTIAEREIIIFADLCARFRVRIRTFKLIDALIQKSA